MLGLNGLEIQICARIPPVLQEVVEAMFRTRSETRRTERSDALKKADFRTFYRDAHAVECLSDREKMLIGLTVAMMRLCDP